MGYNSYHIYIVTDVKRNGLETGITADLSMRMFHLKHGLFDPAANTKCYYLLYWESFENIHDAINRELEIKALSFKEKKKIIEKANPQWDFLEGNVN